MSGAEGLFEGFRPGSSGALGGPFQLEEEIAAFISSPRRDIGQQRNIVALQNGVCGVGVVQESGVIRRKLPSFIYAPPSVPVLPPPRPGWKAQKSLWPRLSFQGAAKPDILCRSAPVELYRTRRQPQLGFNSRLASKKNSTETAQTCRQYSVIFLHSTLYLSIVTVAAGVLRTQNRNNNHGTNSIKRCKAPSYPPSLLLGALIRAGTGFFPD